MRRIAKRTIEALLAHGGPAGWAATRRPESVLVLAYHNIVPDDARRVGELQLHLTLSQFKAQLDYLQATHEIVELASVRADGSSAKRPRAALTFDDAYRGALQYGLPEVVARGVPATVFVAPGILGTDGCWWDQLAAPDGSGLPPWKRDHAVHTLRGDSDAVLAWARATGQTLAPLPGFAGIATEDELRTAGRTAGIRFAAHTWTHCNLRYLAKDARSLELELPLAWLRQRFEGVLPWLAFPYGEFGPATRTEVETAGYEGALRVEGGRITPDARANFVLPRFGVNAELTPDGFILRASGLLNP